MLGRFLEISVHTPDIQASLGFYESLGFRQTSVSETWPYPYAVVTDGRLFLGLHGAHIRSPALTFVLPQLSRSIEALREAHPKVRRLRGRKPLPEGAGGVVLNRRPRRRELLHAKSVLRKQRRLGVRWQSGLADQLHCPLGQHLGSLRGWAGHERSLS